MTHREITASYIRSILHYDPFTGVFRWTGGRQKTQAGAAAGTLNKRGRRVITINGRGYFASRLAWLYVHGIWPVNQIDHRDLDRANDRIANLRESSNGQNCANRRSWAKSGFKGVVARKGRWIAQIKHAGKVRHLGVFDAPEDAHQAYVNAATDLHGHFARAS